MAETVSPPLTLPELARIVRQTDPSALLVPPRIVRRVIKSERGVSFLGWHGAHRESYATTGEAARGIVDEAELGLPAGSSWPETVLLLVEPEAGELAESPPEAILARYWRLLFHTRIHAALDERIRAGAFGPDALRERIERIGRREFEEARAVLRHDGRLLPPRDDLGVYREFVSVFLELRYFAPALLPHEFPALDNTAAIEAVLADELDAPAIFAATRLTGAADPSVAAPADESADDDETDDDVPVAEELRSDAYRRLGERAEAAARRENFARAAILWTRAGRKGGPAFERRGRAAARAEIDRLVRRLQPALAFDDTERDIWKRALPPLLDRSSRGFWTAEARLLYDLQKVANDHEHEVFTVDLVEWIRSRGRRPLRRALPELRGVMISHHLQRAAHRLPATRVTRDARERLGALLSAAAARVGQELRGRCRPVIDATLADNGFRPRNLPEQVAYDKLIDELLDRIIDGGHLTLGNLRDAVSRSHLKLPDLSGPREWLQGDQLLRTDSALAEALDGVYRRGEVYLRGLQRVAALLFGTAWGRPLTLFLILPYGATFVGLKGVGHLLELFGVEVELAHPWTVLMLGTLALGLINSRPFRSDCLASLSAIARAARDAIVGSCRWLLRQPWVRAVVESPLFTNAWRYLLKPLAVSVPVLALGSLAGFPWRNLARAEGGVLVLVSVLLNSRLGRDAEEIIAESAARLWNRFWLDLILGLFRWVRTVSQQLLEAVERVLYAVDEWLRFRSGQRRPALVVRAVLGFAWFFVAYLVRFYVNLLIEPQVNPIKHFPVVTVSHKFILPLSKTLTVLLAAPLMPLVGSVAGYFIAGTTVLLLPGVFGFLVWEMTANWRLYEANRPESLQRALVGHHGETMARLLRPGFHSGTVPKLFARLRRAERRGLDGTPDNSVPRRLDALEHVRHEVERFIERDFLGLLRGCSSSGDPVPTVAAVDLATNRIRITLDLGTTAGTRVLDFAEECGVLVVTISGDSLGILTEPPRSAFDLALLGFSKMSAADVARSSAGDHPLGQVIVPWNLWVGAWERLAEGEPKDPGAALHDARNAASAYQDACRETLGVACPQTRVGE